LAYSDSSRVDGIIIETDYQEIYFFHEPILLNYIVLLIVSTSHNYTDYQKFVLIDFKITQFVD